MSEYQAFYNNSEINKDIRQEGLQFQEGSSGKPEEKKTNSQERRKINVSKNGSSREIKAKGYKKGIAKEIQIACATNDIDGSLALDGKVSRIEDSISSSSPSKSAHPIEQGRREQC